MNPFEPRTPRAHHVALAVLLGVHFVLQLLLILPIALVVLPFAAVAALGHAASRESGVRGPIDPPGNQSTRRST